MSNRNRLFLLLAAAAVLGNAGCLSLLLPANVGAPLALEGRPISGTVSATLKEVAESDAEAPYYWLEIARLDTGGTVGGFVSPVDTHDGALVLLLDGGSTFHADGELGAARAHYLDFGGEFRDAGFMTWCLVLPEYGTRYGEEDLAQTLEVLDWLDRGGREFLGVERVYIVGYSAGANTANLVNTQRDVTAIVSLAGLSQADQLESFYGLLHVPQPHLPAEHGL